MMKKHLLYISTIIAVAMTGSAWADNPSCSAFPGSASKCSSMGYIYSTTACSGRQMVKCPFDDSKVWCKTAAPKTCAVGDILFSNYKCYADLAALPSGLTPIAVVFDATNKLAVDLIATSQGGYLTTNSGYSGVVDTSTGSGLNIVEAMSGYCGTATASPRYRRGCAVSGVSMIKDDENNSTPYSTFNSDSYKTTVSNQRGFLETKALFAVSGKYAYSGTTGSPKFATGPAKYCYYTKNGGGGTGGTCCHLEMCGVVNNCPIALGQVPIHPWFMPAIGDYITIHNNITAVNSGITKANSIFGTSVTTLSGTTSSHSTTMAYRYTSANKWDYMYSWGARRLTEDWTTASSTGTYFPDNRFDYSDGWQTRCIIYYGDDWTVGNDPVEEEEIIGL